MNTTRQEHLEWCKRRALEYVDVGDCHQAYASFISDMSKHDETKDHVALQLGMMLMMSGQLGSSEKMREFILGFN